MTHRQTQTLKNINLTRKQAAQVLQINGFTLTFPKGATVLGLTLDEDSPTPLSILWRKHWMTNLKTATGVNGNTKNVISAESMRQFMAEHQEASTKPATLRNNLTNCIMDTKGRIVDYKKPPRLRRV
tara:strand:- start:508 stop:888 length:381 start_codon:yes stop_codon:yes gene_type:complete